MNTTGFAVRLALRAIRLRAAAISRRTGRGLARLSSIGKKRG